MVFTSKISVGSKSGATLQVLEKGQRYPYPPVKKIAISKSDKGDVETAIQSVEFYTSITTVSSTNRWDLSVGIGSICKCIVIDTNLWLSCGRQIL